MYLKTLLFKLVSLKRSNVKNISGFTLLELLVALVMASIIITSLLTFVLGVLDSDRRERAKIESQEEIQAGLDYIARDMEEAIYIYDADGMYLNTTASGNGAPPPASIVQQIPSGSDRTPILIFWKREHLDRNDTIETSRVPSISKQVGCLDYPGPTCDDASVPPLPLGSDKFRYSLVVYYLIKDTGGSNWSNTSRIARWELKDGIRWSCVNPSAAAQDDPASCPIADKEFRVDGVPTAGINWNVDTNRYVVLPDAGFLRFDASGAGSLSDRLNRWKVAAVNTANDAVTLIDYIDDTDYVAAQDNPGIWPIKIGLAKNNPIAAGTYPPTTPSKNPDCDRVETGVGVGLTDAEVGTAIQTTRNVFAQRVPPDFTSTFTVNGILTNPTGFSSFYTCVIADKVTARVYIRGNALARLERNKSLRDVTDDKRASFVPTSSVRVFGRGSLSLE